MNATSENTILLRLKTGDQSAFQSIYSKHFQPLYLFALKFTDESTAKDIVQDCFFELWQNRTKLEIHSSLSAYLFITVKNRCFKHFQNEKRRTENSENAGWQLQQMEFDYFFNSEKSILEFDIRDRIEKTYQRLPEKCSEVFTESRINGLSNKEIADKLSISVKAVEKHISKALKLFREEFGDILFLVLFLLIQKT